MIFILNVYEAIPHVAKVCDSDPLWMTFTYAELEEYGRQRNRAMPISLTKLEAALLDAGAVPASPNSGVYRISKHVVETLPPWGMRRDAKGRATISKALLESIR